MKVGRSASPISSHNGSGSGSVATISEYTGTTDRRRPARPGVKPSVARMTAAARTWPAEVLTRLGAIDSTAVCS